MACPQCSDSLSKGLNRCPGCATRLGDTGALAAVEAEELLARVRRELGHDYEVQAELGRGGMAVVYRAVELELLRPVALKVLPPELASAQTMAERFKREARLAASFDHPNIIPIYRVGQRGGVFFIAMKFIEGRSLDDIIEQQGPLPIPVVLHVLRAATRALAFAHRNNVVHRDVKGANILIDQDGRIVVTDFGIARASEDAGLTQTGLLMGTPYFMSPEQCAGHRVGQQSDQYSLGIVAFQMLAGVVPFRAETIPGIMQHHFFTPVPSLRDVRTDVPRALVDVVNKALAKRPGDRYVSTQDMMVAVDAIPFSEDDRRRGEALLRDLVLGVNVAKVDASVLPPLAETQIMAVPTAEALRAKQEGERRRRTGMVVAGVAGAALMTTLGFTMARRGGPADTTSVPPAPAASPAAVRDSLPTPVAPRPGAAAPRARSAELPAARSLAAAPAAARDSARADSQRAVAPTIAAKPALHDSGGATGTRPAETAPAAPAAPAAESGRLRVRVYPTDAGIVVDGRMLGRGVVLDSVVPAGPRRLLVAAPGYLALDTVVVVRPGEITQIGTLRLTPVGNP